MHISTVPWARCKTRGFKMPSMDFSYIKTNSHGNRTLLKRAICLNYIYIISPLYFYNVKLCCQINPQCLLSLLPPASEGWGKVLFSVCLSVHISGEVPQLGIGGYPIPGPLGTPLIRSGWVPPRTWDGVPPQTWDRIPSWTWDGVPPPDLGWGTP